MIDFSREVLLLFSFFFFLSLDSSLHFFFFLMSGMSHQFFRRIGTLTSFSISLSCLGSTAQSFLTFPYFKISSSYHSESSQVRSRTPNSLLNYYPLLNRTWRSIGISCQIADMWKIWISHSDIFAMKFFTLSTLFKAMKIWKNK